MRALCADVADLNVVPQFLIGSARVDLADEDLRIVLEADSFEWHGSRAALRRDARRYNALVIAGWLVLRFTWDQVMFEPDEVRRILAQAVAVAQRRSKS